MSDLHPLEKCFTRNDEFALYDRVASYAVALEAALRESAEVRLDTTPVNESG
jgi:hypothetical protein